MAKKILLVWLASEILFGVTFLLFDHHPVEIIGVVSYSIEWLLFLISVVVAYHEPNRKNKFIFYNFAGFFSVSLLFHAYNFLGVSLFPSQPFARLYFTQYVSYGAYFFFLAFALVYLTLDALFRDFRTVYKYALAVGIVGGFFAYYYQGFLMNPQYLYATNETQVFRTLDKARADYVKQHGAEPSIQELAQSADLKVWNNGEPIGSLYPEEKLRVTSEVYPYLSGENYRVFLQRPLYLNAIYMCVISVGFTLLFFGYQYMKDPPQGAYIDKIMFLFLIFTTMEIMHAWSFLKSVEWTNFYELMGIGNAVSMCILLGIAVFFSLRLRFIRSVRGEFYEQEILESPASVTRWRDALDDLLVAHFFNRKALTGRLFVSSSERK